MASTMLIDYNDRWPAFVLPKEDELLSSWLLRNIHAHHVKAHSFCKIVWPHLAFWNRDLDRLAHSEVWQLIANKVGVSPERGYQTTLASYEGVLFKRAFAHGSTFWILPLGIYHRTYTHYGMQFCPSCLRKDHMRPYYRRWWRLALAIGCPSCGCQLLDACPFCQRPIMFHRNEIGRKNELAAHSLSYCTGCHADLADLQTEMLPLSLLSLQKEWYQRLTVSPTENSGHEYFDVLHQLCMLLVSKRPSLVRFQQAIAKQVGVPFTQPLGGFQHRVEVLRTEARIPLLLQIAWLIEEWPRHLLDTIRQTNTRLSSVLAEPQKLPKEFLTLVLEMSST